MFQKKTFRSRLLQTAILSAALPFILTACSAKIEGGNGDFPVPSPSASSEFFDSKPTIAGLALDGHWQSQCHRKPATALYRQFELIVQANKISRSEHLFQEADCIVSGSTIENHGRFRFIDQFQEGSFGIEYAFDQAGGVTTFPQEKMMIKEGLLYLADFSTGEAAEVLIDEPLFLIQQ